MKRRISNQQLTAITIVVLGLAGSTAASAGAGIGVTVGTGPDHYLSRGASIGLWSGDGRLSAGVSRRESESGNSAANDTKETRATLALQRESGVGLSGNYTRNDEPDMEIESLGAGVSLPLDTAHSTRLFLDYRAATYTGKGALRVQLDRDEYSAGLSHTFSDRLSFGGSYSRYQYSPDPVLLQTVFKRRQQRNLATSSVLLDLLDYGWSLNADWRLTERQTLGLFYNRAYNLFGERSSVTTLSDRIQLGDSWAVDLSASRIADSAGRGDYYDLGLHYYLD